MSTKVIVEEVSWTVTVKFNSVESTYELSGPGLTYAQAKVKGVRLFMEEHEIPGSFNHFVKAYTGAFEVSIRKVIPDKLRQVRPTHPPRFYIEQAERLRKFIRVSQLDENTKVEATRLLVKLKGVLDGK
jgi:hypothetical protein